MLTLVARARLICALGDSALLGLIKEMDDVGYSIFEGVLSRRECDLVANSVGGSSTQGGRAGARNLMSKAVIRTLASDDRLLRLASDALGTQAVPFRATLFGKSRSANWHVMWHQDRALPMTARFDSPEWGPWSTKAGVVYALAPSWALERVVALRVHLDPSTHDNGPLRVIAKSHMAGILDDGDILRATHARPADTCVVGRGGVVAMRPLLLHSSMKALRPEPRRVIHIEYSGNLDLGEGACLCVA